MKFNIKPTDARYVVNKNKNIVICIIDQTHDLFKKFVDENFVLGHDCDSEWTQKNTKKYKISRLSDLVEMPNRFIGVARCSDEDDWSVETGKLIAFSRAKDKVNKSFFKRANTYINYLDKHVDNAAAILDQLGVKLAINTEHRHNLIDSLVGTEQDGMQRD